MRLAPALLAVAVATTTGCTGSSSPAGDPSSDAVSASASSPAASPSSSGPVDPSVAPGQVVEGSRGTTQYRLVVGQQGTRVALTFQTRAAGGQPWGSSGTATATATAGGRVISAVIGGTVGDDYFLGGLVPKAAVRVVHRATPRSPPVAVRVYPQNGVDANVFGGFVGRHGKDSVVTAYDASGGVVATSSR
ncbi:MAG: hypothetical protein ACXV4A_04730 [Actinomycetes bacterium]